MGLTARQEAFCQAYAQAPNGAAAARAAGYKETHAANQALRLLQRPDIAARIAELGGAASERHAAAIQERDAAARELAAQLLPVYAANLKARDFDGVRQTVELQARIRNLVSGGSTVRPLGHRPEAGEDDDGENTLTDAATNASNAADRAYEVTGCLVEDVRKLRRRLEKIEHCFSRTVDVVDPENQSNLRRWFHQQIIDWDDEEGYFIDDLEAEESEADSDETPNEKPMEADADADRSR